MSSSSAIPTTGPRPPSLIAVEFKVIPDATTRALELRKQSADVAINSLVADTVVDAATRSRPHRHASRRAPSTPISR